MSTAELRQNSLHEVSETEEFLVTVLLGLHGTQEESKQKHDRRCDFVHR